MTPLKMAESAANALAEPGSLGLVLTIKKGKMPPGFPRGELLNEMNRNGVIERTYSFQPMKVLRWLVKNGLVEMVIKDETTVQIFEVKPGESE